MESPKKNKVTVPSNGYNVVFEINARDGQLMPLVSVIIPVYNREEYIGRCVSSICRQSYDNIEIIIVDDGSTDDTRRVCEDLRNQDKRIVYIRKRNEGSGFARNAGIEAAEGRYIFFVDSDDYIHEFAIEKMIFISENNDADIVKCGYERGTSDGFSKNKVREHSKVIDNIEAFRSRDVNIAVWGKLYKKEVIGDLRYPKETLYDDEFFTYKCIYNAKKIVIMSECLYYNYMSRDSIMRNNKAVMPIEKMTRAYRERAEYFSQKKENELVGITLKEYAIRLILFYRDSEKYIDAKQRRDQIVRKYNNIYVRSRKYASGIKEKVAMDLFRYNPNLTSGLLKRIM